MKIFLLILSLTLKFLKLDKPHNTPTAHTHTLKHTHTLCTGSTSTTAGTRYRKVVREYCITVPPRVCVRRYSTW